MSFTLEWIAKTKHFVSVDCTSLLGYHCAIYQKRGLSLHRTNIIISMKVSIVYVFDCVVICCSSTDVVLEDFILSQCKGPALRITNEAFADPFVDPDELQGVPFQTTHILHVDFYDNRDEETGFNADGGAIGISGGSNVTVVGCLFRCDLHPMILH